jgi:hypothetical protein
MRIRIAIWASIGALVVTFWAFYAVATSPGPFAATGILPALVDLTCPIALARHHTLSFGLVLLGNAATYALVGAAVETIRRHSHSLPTSN